MQRLLVVLPNWLGEVLFATPLLKAIRERNATLHITALGWPQCRPLLQPGPLVDDYIDYDERGWRRLWFLQGRLMRRLRAARFDAAVLLRPSLSRGVVLKLAGIPRRIGWRDRRSWPLNETHTFQPFGGPVTAAYNAASVRHYHKAATYLPLLQSFGIDPQSVDLRVYYTATEAERAEARILLQQCGVDLAQRPIVFLHPGANWVHKQWPAARLAELGKRLLQATPAQLIISGALHERAEAERIAQVIGPAASGSAPAAVVLAGRTSLRAMAACLTFADLVVANDTGLMHLAVALQRPTVALFGPTTPVLTGPLGDPRLTRVIHHPECCPYIPCHEPDVSEALGMRAIAVDEVLRTSLDLLSRGS